jgi:hypothetical protein
MTVRSRLLFSMGWTKDIQLSETRLLNFFNVKLVEVRRSVQNPVHFA